MAEKSILRSMNKALKMELQKVIHDLTDTEIGYSAPSIDERSICDVAIHAHRPLLAVASVITGREWPARPPRPKDCVALGVLLGEMAEQIDEWLVESDDRVLSKPVTLRWGDFPTGTEAMINSLTHGFVHVGAIRGIRALGGFPTPPEA